MSNKKKLEIHPLFFCNFKRMEAIILDAFWVVAKITGNKALTADFLNFIEV